MPPAEDTLLRLTLSWLHFHPQRLQNRGSFFRHQVNIDQSRISLSWDPHYWEKSVRNFICSLPFMARYPSDFLFTHWEVWIINSDYRHLSVLSCRAPADRHHPVQPTVLHTGSGHLHQPGQGVKEGTSNDARCSTAWNANISQSEVCHTISVVHIDKIPLLVPTSFFSSWLIGRKERLCVSTGHWPKGLPHLQASNPIILKNAKSHGREISLWCSERSSVLLSMCRQSRIQLIWMKCYS